MKTLSKSLYVAGMQCHKLLWLKYHTPKADELVPDAATAVLFRKGTAVGRVAMDFIKGGTEIEFKGNKLDRVKLTQDLITSGETIIYEASFLVDNVFCAVDILHKGAYGWIVTEVKSGTKPDPKKHYNDVALQCYIVEKSGLPVQQAELMTLNRDCIYPDMSNLFARHDVTFGISNHLASVPENISQHQTIIDGPIPHCDKSVACFSPYPCPFLETCHGAEADNHVSKMYYFKRARTIELENRGIDTIEKMPIGEKVNKTQARQIESTKSGKMIVDKVNLKKALDKLESPIGFLDFETMQLTIPKWDGCRPYDQLPVQYSYHEEMDNGEHSHKEYLARQNFDCRLELAERMIEDCKNAKTILVYYQSFEKTRIKELAAYLPDLAADLENLSSRIVDLLPIVRTNIYDPGFVGSFSIKKVGPVLCPTCDYSTLEVQNGLQAMNVLETILFSSTPVDSKTVKDLLAYCGLDTWIMVEMLAELRRLAE